MLQAVSACVVIGALFAGAPQAEDGAREPPRALDDEVEVESDGESGDEGGHESDDEGDDEGPPTLSDCEDLLVDRAHGATACFDDAAAASLGEEHLAASALADLARDLEAAPPPAPPSDAVSVSRLIESGAPELVVHSSAYGGVAGFLGAATLLSATRLSNIDSLPWLIGAPAFGILAGAALSSTTAYFVPFDAGDAAVVSSSLWVGSAWGFGLQLAVFDQRDDVGHLPWRFATILGGGLGLGGLGGLMALGLELDPGDVGVMNSAALWGPVLTWMFYGTVLAAGQGYFAPPDLPTAVTLTLASSMLPWAGALALYPFVDVVRPATWLIEAGGVAGILTGMAAFAFLAQYSFPPWVYSGMVLTTTTGGVVAGAAAGWLLSSLLARFDVARVTDPLFSLSPTLLPPAPTVASRALAPGALLTFRF